MPEEDRKLYRNREDYVIGVVALDHRNEPKGVPLQPGQTIWLNPVEIRLTANAPSATENNPFEKGSLEEIDPEARSTDAPVVAPEPEAPVSPLPDGAEEGTLPAPPPEEPEPEPAGEEGKVIPPEDVEATLAAKAALEAEEKAKAEDAERVAAEEQAAQQPEPQIEEETGTQVEPGQQGEGEEGQAKEEEEVATPEAALIQRAEAVGVSHETADSTEDLEAKVLAAEEAATSPSTVADLERERASGKGKW